MASQGGHPGRTLIALAVIIAGLAPIMWSEGAGAEIMQRIAAPMIGGMITAPLLSMLVIPAAYLLMRKPRVRKLRFFNRAALRGEAR